MSEAKNTLYKTMPEKYGREATDAMGNGRYVREPYKLSDDGVWTYHVHIDQVQTECNELKPLKMQGIKTRINTY